MSRLVVLDADVLGRRRTGDETYVRELLRALPDPAAEAGFRLAAITRRPDLVPDGVEPVEVQARSQETRMLWGVPMAIGRLAPALVHFQHALPLRCPTPAVVTVHDLSFERDWGAMPAKDTLAFRATVRLAVRRARRVIAVSERTKRDLIELYRTPEAKVVVIPHGVGATFGPAEDGGPRLYLLFVGAIQERKDPLAAADAASAVGLPLVVVGPEKEPKLARELERRGAELRGYVEADALAELYRGAAALVLPSRYEGFGLPVLEAMASGTPVDAAPDRALREVAGDAALYADRRELAEAVRRAVADPAPLAAAGLRRARRFSWAEAARRTVDVYAGAIA